MNGDIKESEYTSLLKKHKEALKAKIDKLQETYENVNQLMKLVRNKNLNYAFEIKHNPERVFCIIESIESNIISSPKKYFEKYKSIIKDDHYSEKALHIIYDYEDLELGEYISSKISFEISTQSEINGKEEEDIFYTNFLDGDYLSVFYEFKRHNFKGLKSLKSKIDNYLVEYGYRLKDHRVIEIEHPDLSLFLEDDSSIYEIQIMIEKKK